MTTAPHQPQPKGPQWLPAQRLTPHATSGRLWRVLLLVGAGLLIGTFGTALGIGTATNRYMARTFSEISPVVSLPATSSLSVTMNSGNAFVMVDTSLEAPRIEFTDSRYDRPHKNDNGVLAKIDVNESAEGVDVHIEHPNFRFGNIFRQGTPSVIITVPDGQEISLDVDMGAGYLNAEGTFADLDLTVDAGDISMNLVGEEPSHVTANATAGGIFATVSPTRPWKIDTSVDAGEAEIDPDIVVVNSGQVGSSAPDSADGGDEAAGSDGGDASGTEPDSVVGSLDLRCTAGNVYVDIP